jgi:hypothetical protein
LALRRQTMNGKSFMRPTNTTSTSMPSQRINTQGSALKKPMSPHSTVTVKRIC